MVDSKTIYVVFPPGANDARFVYQINGLFKGNADRIVSITYPSRFKSSRIEGFDSIDEISDQISRFLNKLLGYKQGLDIRFMAFSFGTAILTRLLQNHGELIRVSSKYSALLVNAGEFFGEKATYIFKSLFEPALNNKKYLRVLRFIVTTCFQFLPRRLYPNSRLLDLNEQWLSIIGYRIDSRYKIDIPTKIILAESDLIVTPESRSKVVNTYTHSEVLYYPGDHIYDYHHVEKYEEAFTLMKNWVKE